MADLAPQHVARDIHMYPTSPLLSFHRLTNATNTTANSNTTTISDIEPIDYIQNYIFIAVLGIYLLLGALFWSITGPSQENERRIREKFSWFLGGKSEWIYGLFVVWFWPLMMIIWWKVERERQRDVEALKDFEEGMGVWLRARKRPMAGAEEGKCRMMLWD